MTNEQQVFSRTLQEDVCAIKDKDRGEFPYLGDGQFVDWSKEDERQLEEEITLHKAPIGGFPDLSDGRYRQTVPFVTRAAVETFHDIKSIQREPVGAFPDLRGVVGPPLNDLQFFRLPSKEGPGR